MHWNTKAEWGLQLAEVYPNLEELEIVDTFIRMAIDTTDAINIWLVESNLRRNHDVSVSTQEESPTFFPLMGGDSSRFNFTTHPFGSNGDASKRKEVAMTWRLIQLHLFARST